jgi:hypothetical protein
MTVLTLPLLAGCLFAPMARPGAGKGEGAERAPKMCEDREGEAVRPAELWSHSGKRKARSPMRLSSIFLTNQ